MQTPSDINIVEIDLNNEHQIREVVSVLDAYAREPAGGSEPLPTDVRERLLTDLGRVSTAVVLGAVDDDCIVGVAVCFRAYSTFKARPLLNLHDLAVLPGQRGRGIGSALLAAIEARARADGCCKLTLEVLDDNHGARRLYARRGFADGGPGQGETTTLFLQKPL